MTISDEDGRARKHDSPENNKNFANEADAHRKVIVDDAVEDLKVLQMELPPHLFPLTIAAKSRAEESAVQPILAIPGISTSLTLMPHLSVRFVSLYVM